jgi:hypothetical protein
LKYQPETYVSEKDHQQSSPATYKAAPFTDYQEFLQESDTQAAEIRAEVSDDLSLGTINSRPDRRGSEATITTHVAAAHTKQADHTQASKAIDNHLVNQFGSKKAKKVAEDAYAVEDGVLYDMSLLRSLFKTVREQWWFCFAIIFCDCKSHFTCLVRVVLIDAKTHCVWVCRLSLDNSFARSVSPTLFKVPKLQICPPQISYSQSRSIMWQALL